MWIYEILYVIAIRVFNVRIGGNWISYVSLGVRRKHEIFGTKFRTDEGCCFSFFSPRLETDIERPSIVYDPRPFGDGMRRKGGFGL